MLKLVRVDTLSPEVFQTLVDIEQSSYPQDEAASPEAMAKRRDLAPELFHVALSTQDNSVYSFVNGTCTDKDELSHETMSTHVAGGQTLCIHSVVTREDLRRQGLARATLRHYLDRIVSSPETAHVKQALLLAKENLVPFYESCGFRSRGASKVEHGQDTWYELGVSLREIPIACANAFNNPDKAFSGNPAAVCVLPFKTRSLDDTAQKWTFDEGEKGIVTMEDGCETFMRAVAAQMNLSETAFLRDLGAGSDDGSVHRFELRWKTPAIEVDLCGHATQASAFSLWSAESGLLPRGMLDNVTTLEFETRSGILRASRDEKGNVSLDFPLESVSEDLYRTDPSRELLIKGLKVDPEDAVFVGKNRLHMLIELASSDLVRECDPDMSILAQAERLGVCITAKYTHSQKYNIASRLFAPAKGILEDPFTGSAHCYLGPYWMKKLGTDEIVALQMSSRTGVAKVNVKVKEHRVLLKGMSEISWTGSLKSAPFQLS